MLDEVNAFVDRKPVIGLALSGALVAVCAYNLFRACRWLAEYAVATHLSDAADDTARAASEALGG